MRIALRLAHRGLGAVEPNPAVGAVIVKGGRIIGRGWHKRFGGPHAEINALEDCKKQGGNPQGATIYLTLEPCCHHGKTAACTDAIVAAGLKRVVVATIDPSKHANGEGIRRLREANIRVDVGECAGESKVLNAAFLKFASTGRTWVMLKWAQTIDGKLDLTGEKSRRRWISCKDSRKDAHNLRRRAGAILVGINTVLKDDPLLTLRPAHGRKPMRMVLDSRLRIPLDCKLLTTAKDSPVIIVASDKAIRTRAKKAEQIEKTGAELLGFPSRVKSNLKFLLNRLSKLGVQHLLVEGGPAVIGSFLKTNLADGIVVYVAPMLGAGGGANIAGGMSNVSLGCVDVKRIGDDIRIAGLTKYGLRAAGIEEG